MLIEFQEVIDPEVNRQVRYLTQQIEAAEIAGVEEAVPAYRTILVHYDPLKVGFRDLVGRLRRLEEWPKDSPPPTPRLLCLPVCYGDVHGPDLPDVADHVGLKEAEVVTIHCQTTYLVYMIGFMPGFPYLGGMSPSIAVPRLAEPRARLPARSVGIAGNQTGIYPIESPGGWRIIGRTPVELYSPEQDPPVLLAMGDFVQFRPVSQQEYGRIREEVKRGTYQVEAKETDGR